MTVLPVVAREMSVLARRKSMYWSRWVTAVVALFVMLWLLVISASQVSFAELGASIFFILSSLCFTFAILIGMHATADCLSEEKREGTLGLLFLTDLKSFDVIGGKLAASSLQAALALIGVIPMISLALLLGGVTLRQFGEVSLVLGNTMFLSLAVGVFVSSVSRNERKAMVGTFVALFIITLGPWIIAYLVRDYLGGFPEKLLAASPLFDFAMIHSGPPTFRPAGPSYFWHSLVALHLLGWALLAISAWILPRAVNELPARRFLRLREFADNFVYGRLADRKRYRAELLDRNAFLWLASRERVKPRYAWGILAFFAALYLWIALQFQNMLFDLAICGAIMFLTHLVFKIWAASEVCSRLIQDRRSGALELLLSTPLSVRQIAEGQSLALRRLFLKPIVVLILIEILLLYNGLNSPLQASAGIRVLLYIVVIGTFLVDLWALKWVGLWLSLTGKSMERVLIATIGRVLFLPWLAYAAVAGFFGAKIVLMQSSMDTGSAVFGWGLLSILISVTLGYGARENFLSQFRELATRRFDSVVEPEPAPKIAPKKAAPTTPVQVKPIRRFRSAVFDVFRRRPVVASLVLLLFVTIVGILLHSEYWSYRLKREIAAITSAGFPATQSEAVRYNPAPASAENGFAILQSSGMNWRFPLTPRANRGATPEEANRAKLAQVAALLNASQSQLRALWRLPEFKRAYLDPLAADFWQMQGSHMNFSAVAEADIIVALDQGGPTGVPVDRIEQSLRSLLAHARLLRSQPLKIAQQCASEALRRLAGVLEEVLKRDLLDDKTLELLLHDARAVDDPEVIVRTLAVQRALFIEPPPNPWMRGGPFVRGPTAVPIQATLIGLMNSLGTRDKAMVEILENYEKAIAIARKPYPRHSEASRLFDQSSMMRIQAMAVAVPPVTLGSIPEVFWTDAAFTANLHLIQTALALERYQRRYGKVPNKLEAVVPEFLSTVPIDPFTGKPLSVYRSSDALLIYSVGVDQGDDTATPLARPAHGTDIVFTFR